MNKGKTNNLLKPHSLLILYANSKETSCYVETSKITYDAGKASMSAPMALAEDVLIGLAQTYMKKNPAGMVHAPLIGDHILSAHSEPGKLLLCWYRPARKMQLNFRKTMLKIESGVYPAPAVLFLLVNKTLSVYALDNDVRPTAKSKLYHAPFFNVYRDGKICMGSATVGRNRRETFEQETERWEGAFFRAEQNMTHNDYKNLPATWKKIKNEKRFPKTELLPFRSLTLASLLEKHTDFNENDFDDEE